MSFLLRVHNGPCVLFFCGFRKYDDSKMGSRRAVELSPTRLAALGGVEVMPYRKIRIP